MRALLERIGNFLGVVWLFFPSILFILIITFLLSQLTIGRDIVQLSLESHLQYTLMPVFFSIWAYTVWYSSRLVSLEKSEHDEGELLKMTPRLLSHISYAVGIYIILHMPAINPGNFIVGLILAVDIIIFFVLNQYAERIASIQLIVNRWFSWPAFILIILAVNGILYVLYGGSEANEEYLLWNLIALFTAFQIFALLHIILRRTSKAKSLIAPRKVNAIFQKAEFLLKFFNLDRDERNYFLSFNVISLFAFIVYAVVVFSIAGAQNLGAFNIVFLCFGIMIGIGNLISFLSIRFKLNLHVIAIALALLTGQMGGDPYDVRIEAKQDYQPEFSERQSLKQFTLNWLKKRQDANHNDSLGTIRMIFVMADGGASRSGYWTTLV